jgi:proteasome lid subunit RPN8/RPN11
MLTILTQLVDAMVAQAERDHPLETCGVIAGPEGSDRPLRLIPMRNIANSTSFFQFDADEQLRVWKDMEHRGEEPVVLYHSHTQSRAYPSEEDVRLAAEPHAHYVIIGTDPARRQEIRSFRIINNEIIEERLRAVEAYQGHTEGQKPPLEHRSTACP